MTHQSESAGQPQAAWQDSLATIVSFWVLVCAPTLRLHSSQLDTTATVVAGAALFLLGCAAMRSGRIWSERAMVACGIAVAAMPWVLGFVLTAAIVNATVCGLGIAALAFWRIRILQAAEVQRTALTRQGGRVRPFPAGPLSPASAMTSAPAARRRTG